MKTRAQILERIKNLCSAETPVVISDDMGKVFEIIRIDSWTGQSKKQAVVLVLGKEIIDPTK